MTESSAETSPTPKLRSLFPRRRVHRGEVGAVATFRRIGEKLLDAHVLFDVWPDDEFPAQRAARYKRVITVADSPETVVAGLPEIRSEFEAPYHVRVSASRPAGSRSEIDVHFVNYNRAELPPGPGGQPNLGAGIADERPVAVSGVMANVVLPEGATLRSVRFLTPEQTQERTFAGERHVRSRSIHRSGVPRLWRGSNRISNARLNGAPPVLRCLRGNHQAYAQTD